MKFNKKFNLVFIMMAMFLLSSIYVNAILVDYEDFESYTPNVDVINLITESSGKWNCTTGYYPDCLSTVGTGEGTNFIQVQEISNYTSKYLRISSLDGDWGDWEEAYIKFDSTDTTTGLYTNFTVSYDMKVFNFECGSGLTNTYQSWFRMQPDTMRWTHSSSYRLMDSSLGGMMNLSSDNLKIRPTYRTSTYDFYPTNVNASVDDYQWHSITKHYIFDSSKKFVRIDQYVDGILQDEIPANYDYSSFTTSSFLEGFSFDARRCFSVGIDNIYIYEEELATPQTLESDGLINCSLTQCSEWADPNYLFEEFNGSIYNCNWATTEEVCFNYELERNESESYYSAFKQNDLLTEENSRYYTLSFDLNPISVNTNGYLAVSLYDSDYQRYIQFFLSDDMGFYNNDGGSSSLVYANVTTSTYKTVQLHIDFTDDNFDLYYDGVKVAESLGLTNSFYDITNVEGLRLSSSSINYKIDNVKISATDQDNKILPSDIPLVQPIDDTVSMCGLFSKTEQSCSVDSDCASDECNPNGKCNKFDMTYCDENGYTRGNKCLISAVTYCTLDETQQIILDNFLLFLVFIIIIIFFVYLMFMLKTR